MGYLIGIDLGTTGCKSMVFDAAGAILGEHYIEYEVFFTEGGGAEQDAEAWWENTVMAVSEAVRKSGIDGSAVLGLAVSAQGSAFVPVDAQCHPLCRAISWYDTRALEEAREMYQEYGEDVLFYRLGHPAESLLLPEVRRIKREAPALYERTWKFLMAHDYLVCRMTGQAVTDCSMAAGTMCYDIEKREWTGDLLDRYGISEAKLPEIRSVGEPVGTLLPDVAARLGISPHAVVAVGMQDQKIAAVGAGIRSGVITVSLGTASAIESVCNRPVRDPAQVIQCHGFSSTLWALESSVDTAGSALKWAKNIFCPDLCYRELDDLAATSPTGANGVTFYPLLFRGITCENQGKYCGIGMETTRADLLRAVLEGVACGIRERIEGQKAVNPALRNAAEIRLFGGGAASPLWCQIIADVINLRVLVPRTHETGNLGAAICAGVGTGLYKDLWSGQKIIGEPAAVYLPQAARREACEALYARYLRFREVSQ